MIYLVENQIVFNPEDNSLSLLSDFESKVIVSNPARRILLLLIEQHGAVVQRETFFKKVWDDYGLNASNNNLNHCISKLRKVIATLGYHDDLIVTVPKMGFIIRKEITVEPYFGPTITQENIAEQEADAIENPELIIPSFTEPEMLSGPVKSVDHSRLVTPTPWPQKRKIIYLLIISTLISTALVVLGYFIFYNDMSDPKAPLQIAKIDTCDLYSTAPLTPSRKSDFIQLAKSFIRANNITCKSGDIFIFQSETLSSPINTGSVRSFMAQCTLDENHKANLCISYYTNDRTTHDK